MPRNPAAKKNQHNSRHENGLVGPGKRVTKQKSNGYLNGNVKSAPPDEPVPVVSNNDSRTSQSTAYSSTHTVSSSSEAPPTLKKQDSESSIDGQDSQWENVNGIANTSQSRPEMAQTKCKPSQDVNPIQVVSTILRSCPAGDTVALLIVLLSLPSMVLTIVQVLFTFLTLMPPTNVSPISFLSLFDVFQGSAGSPSWGTMAIVDVICFGLWICLWNWAQHFALDVAQIQIAMTLGNGNSGKNSTVNLFCFMIVLFIHAVRSYGVRRFFLSRLVPTSLLSEPAFAQITQYLPFESDFGQTPGAPSKISNLFAIHILSQALMAFVRRRVAHSQANPSVKSARRTDTEAHAGYNIPEPLDIEATRASATGVDHQPPPTPGFKDSKDKVASAKKRRRQANQVRNRQPFWAALASTKVIVLREAEHNGSSARAEVQKPLIPQSQDTIWITNVEPSTIEFEASLSSIESRGQDRGAQPERKPISVRINGARWQLTLDPMEESSGSRNLFSGMISGLAPDCTYTCSFAREDEEEFASIMVKTPALQDRDLPPSFVPPPPRAPLRPHSPTTTLRNSISTAEAKLGEAKARLTKTRRTHRAGVTRVEKEVDALNVRLKSAGDDHRQRQRLLQAERNIQQSEKETEDIAVALSELEAIPEDDSADYDSKKQAFEEKSQVLATVNEALSAARTQAKNELDCTKNELDSITSRKQRLQARQNKLAGQQDRMNQANAQGINEKERKAQESARLEADRASREANLAEGINTMWKELADVQAITRSHWREIETLDSQEFAQRESMLRNSGPLTPEGNLPGTNPQFNRSLAYGNYPAPVLEAQSSPFVAFAKTLPSDTRRPRSNTARSLGAISNFSGDAFEDADPIPPMPSSSNYEPATLDGRKGSGSSRGKNNGSPAGVIGDGLRSHHKGSYSPGNMQAMSTW